MQGVAPLVQGLIWLCLQRAKRKALCTKRKQQQTKVYANGMRGRGGSFYPKPAAGLGTICHMVLTLDSQRVQERGGCEILLH